MGCHTWAYRKIKNVDTFRNIIEQSIDEMIDFVSDTTLKTSIEENRPYLIDNFNAYMESVEEGEQSYDPDDVCYVDEDTGERVMYHLETYEQFVKRFNKYILKLKTILREINQHKDYDSCVDKFNDYINIIQQCLSADYSIRIHGGAVYVRELEDGYIQLNNPFDEYTGLFFRVYGYPCEHEDKFYVGSPTGKNPHGWTDAESLIEFLEWYKDVCDCDEPYCLECKNDDNTWKLHYGYDEFLYDKIRKFFSKFEKNEILIEFS